MSQLVFGNSFAIYCFILMIKSFNLVTLCDLVTVFMETKSVTKSRLQRTSNYTGGGPSAKEKTVLIPSFNCLKYLVFII